MRIIFPPFSSTIEHTRILSVLPGHIASRVRVDAAAVELERLQSVVREAECPVIAVLEGREPLTPGL